ncbi:MAG TPA: SDR family NAD(P)-dependent oxidoreductase [Mycobacteriales bacterium]|nr:SDR family NAD(P)-dependent oxidoreductase [Mycobacteriales bacterium]
MTGGSRGIGAETCRFFAANGMKVAVCGRDKDAIQSVVDDLRSRSAAAIGVAADCTDRGAIDQLFDTTSRQLGPVDVLAVFAGFDLGPGSVEQVTEEAWRSVIDGNLTATFLTVQAVLAGMVERRGGSIITMSSAAGRLPGWSSVAYAAAKAGILMLTRRVALDVGRHNIRINALAPSAILTERQEQRIPEVVRNRVIEEQFPIARWGTPADCANAALFLASDASSWITGATIDIAGGKIMM